MEPNTRYSCKPGDLLQRLSKHQVAIWIQPFPNIYLRFEIRITYISCSSFFTCSPHARAERCRARQRREGPQAREGGSIDTAHTSASWTGSSPAAPEAKHLILSLRAVDLFLEVCDTNGNLNNFGPSHSITLYSHNSHRGKSVRVVLERH